MRIFKLFCFRIFNQSDKFLSKQSAKKQLQNKNTKNVKCETVVLKYTSVVGYWFSKFERKKRNTTFR